jgi:outer membrane protein assembly factor BamB
MRRLAFVFSAVCCVCITADDWPGWRGADRTGVSQEKGVLAKWPSGGPEQKWKATGIGEGYSTPSVSDGKIFVVGAKGGKEYTFALKLDDGAHLWEQELGPTTKGGGFPGPRSTPTIDGDLLYVLSSAGDLVCMSVAGKKNWSKNLKRDFGGSPGGWAYAESPLVDGDRIVVTPGGDKQTMVCLNKTTGKPIWKSAIPGAGEAAYSSILPIEVGKAKQYVTFVSKSLVAVDAKTGRFAWKYDGSVNRTANASTAVAKDGLVFSASGYGKGGGTVKAGLKDAKEEYFVKEFKSHHGGFVLVGDHVYGTNYEALLCMNFKTGEIVWSNPSVGKGSITAVGDLLVVRSEQGPVALVRATPSGYEELGRFEQPNRSRESAWPYPVVSNGLLLLRDQDVLLAYDVKAAK